MSPDTINVSATDLRERKRRRRELTLALVCFLAVIVLTWVELRFLGVNSYLFLGLFNLNFILLLLVLFIVTRNGVKLLLERRRKVLGSRLRTRLVLAFISLSLIPTVLMFLVSLKFVQTSVDYWFKGQVEDSMQQALELGRSFYASAQDRLERRGRTMLREIKARNYAWGGRAMDKYLDEKFVDFDLSLLGLIGPDAKDLNRHPDPGWETLWPEIKERVDWEGLRSTPRYWSTIMPTAGQDLIVGLLPVDEGRAGYLLVGENIGQGLLFRLDQVVRGLDEYKKLKTLKSPWKMTLYLTLGVMTMLILLGAIWFGFRLAKEISAPVQALAAGTERVARGDLSVRLEDPSDDELGFLVQSFNRMTEDLSESQMSLTEANERLAQQNKELERRGRYIEAVLDNITSGVISMDVQGFIGTVNQAAQHILGVDARFLIGRRPMDLLYGEFAELMNDAFLAVTGNPTVSWQRAFDLPLPSRQLKVLASVVALRGGDGRATGLVAVFEDITELEKIQRLAAWREVARRIAHEIKNPLTPIKLSAQRLQRRFGQFADDTVFEECTGIIIKQVERMQQMVTEFSSYAKLPEVTPRPGSPAPLLEEAVGMFSVTHREIDWSLDIQGAIPEIPLDHEAMRRVLINLLTNAAEALEGQEGGAVAVTARHDPARGVVDLRVRDNGPGFSAEERSRMFEPYFSRKKTGTGLGLTIVRSIITDHHGQVRVEPNSPQGSVFIVELPDR
ncbi:ATP-binding protein [Desulfovibrio aminophilus]|nr:ATP-binding protein [Desulfovibrio aminophilus]MCM0755730.1 ATP-binding protein [Desulfovibrio aminophilus]